MATISDRAEINTSRVNVSRFAFTGALAAITFFILCWIGGFLPFGPATHMYVQLFTDAQPSSGLALLQGVCWSLVFGLVAGGLIAFYYNLLALLDAR